MFFISKVLKRYSLGDIIRTAFEYLFGYPLLLFSYIIPRSRNKWVFGNKVGFLDNTKYLYVYLLENTSDCVLWVSSDRTMLSELKRKGLPVCYKYSLIGLYHLLTANYYVCTVTTRYICYWTSGGSHKVNLWHGIGLKAIGDKSASLKDFSMASRIMIPYAYEKYSLFLSTSEMMNAHFSKSFRLSPDVIYDGIYPRCAFLNSSRNYLDSFVERYENDGTKQIIGKIKNYSRTYIYMPTWRLNLGADFLQYAIPDLDRLNEALSVSNSLLLLKLHPSMKYHPEDMSTYTNIIYVSPELDVYPILPFTDILITDYSSIYYDYLLMNDKGCILYDFDYEQYIKTEFNMIADYKEYTPGVHVDNFDALVSLIRNVYKCNIDKREWILDKFWGDYKKKSTKDLVGEILKR